MNIKERIEHLETRVNSLNRELNNAGVYIRYFGAVERGRLETVITHTFPVGKRETVVGRIVSVDDNRDHDLLVLGLAEAPDATPNLYGLDQFVDMADKTHGHYGPALHSLADRIKRHLAGIEYCQGCGDGEAIEDGLCSQCLLNRDHLDVTQYDGPEEADVNF